MTQTPLCATCKQRLTLSGGIWYSAGSYPRCTAVYPPRPHKP